MKKWFAVALASGGLAAVLVAFILGATHAEQRLSASPTDLRDSDHTSIEAPLAPAISEPSSASVDPAYVPVILHADTDPSSLIYPSTMSGDELANAHGWIQTQILTAQCMRDKGYDYTFTPFWAGQVTSSWISELPEADQQAASEALDGPESRFSPDVEYDWKNAGCWGYAVHSMENDDAK